MINIKQYLIPILLVYVVCFHFVGQVLYQDYAYAFGYLLIPLIIGLSIVYRAKSRRGVMGGLITLFILSAGLTWQETNDVIRKIHADFFDGCRNRNQLVLQSEIADDEKDKFCNCVGNLIVDDIFWHSAKSLVLFKEPLPPLQDLEIETRVNAAWLNCEAKL